MTSKSLLWPCVFTCILLVFLNPQKISGATTASPRMIKAAVDSAQAVNLADFGAVGDGTSDDGPAFQKALDALAEAGGGTLFVPAGHYLIASPVTQDFTGINASLTIQGVPSDTMPAPPTAGGDQLSATLDLVSEIIPATGSVDSAFTLSNITELKIEHLGFTGREPVITDAFITLNLSDITHASIYHCQFYGLSTFGKVAGQGGGNIIRAVRSDLTIQQSVCLGSTADSGAYAPIVENIEWKGFTISNSIFLDYGQGPFYGKMGLGAPLSWINFAGQAPKTADSSRRQIVIKDIFLDEGGWVGITAYPHLWTTEPIDLIYISGLRMNVSNFGTAGHQFFNVSKVLIENSYYGWTHQTIAAVDLYRCGHAIFDQSTGVASANRIRADDRTERMTVINSKFDNIDSLAQTTKVLETSPEDDPVQYVRNQFLSVLGRQPDPGSLFYWADLFLRCDDDHNCSDSAHTAFNEYLNKKPESNFSLTGTVVDDQGNPLKDVTLNLSGADSITTSTDEEGVFHFSGLATSGVYTITASKAHYSFATNSQTFIRPVRDVSVAFDARLIRHSIAGRIAKANGTGVSGVKVQLLQSSSFAITNANGEYSFAGLPEGDTYIIAPSAEGAAFFPANTTIVDLPADASANFTMRLLPELLTIGDSDNALVLQSVSFLTTSPLGLFDDLNFAPDGINRFILFGKNLEDFNDLSQYSILAEDSEGQKYPVAIEFVGDTPQQGWLKQLNVKLSPHLSAKCVDLTLSVAGLTSVPTNVCLAQH